MHMKKERNHGQEQLKIKARSHFSIAFSSLVLVGIRLQTVVIRLRENLTPLAIARSPHP